MTILEHWGITVKLKCFHTFCISYWNLKYFKPFCIQCMVVAMKEFPIEFMFTCAKIYLNQIKVKINPTLWSCGSTLELEFSFFFWFSAGNLISFRQNMTTYVFNHCSITIYFMLFFTSSGKNWASSTLFLHFFCKINRKDVILFKCEEYGLVSLMDT